MRKRLLLPRSLGTAEWVLLLWEDPGGCDGISSAQGSQLSNRILDSQVPEHPCGLIKFSRGYREGICGSYQVPAWGLVQGSIRVSIRS